MNKIKNLFVIILFALVAFSCSDILDKGPLDKYSENDVWKSTDLTQAFIYTALANATNMMVWKDNWTDNEAIMEDGRDVNAELIDRYYDAGWNKYEDIRRCNMVLARVPEAPFTNAEKANFIAQAKTIRAMIYFTRARLFGKLMLVKELIEDNFNFISTKRSAQRFRVSFPAIPEGLFRWQKRSNSERVISCPLIRINTGSCWAWPAIAPNKQVSVPTRIFFISFYIQMFISKQKK